MSEFGQIVDIQLSEPVCGISEFPEIIIDSETGDGAIIEPILTFTPIEEFNETDDDVFVDPLEVDSDSVINAQISSNDIDGLITTLRGDKYSQKLKTLIERVLFVS